MIARALRLGLGSLLLLAALPAWRGPARAGWQPALAGPAITAGQAITSALSRAPAAPEAEVGPDDFRVSYMGADKLFDLAPATGGRARREAPTTCAATRRTTC